MNTVTELWLFAVSVAASALGGMLGMASGIFIAPILTIFAHVDIRIAICRNCFVHSPAHPARDPHVYYLFEGPRLSICSRRCRCPSDHIYRLCRWRPIQIVARPWKLTVD